MDAAITVNYGAVGHRAIGRVQAYSSGEIANSYIPNYHVRCLYKHNTLVVWTKTVQAAHALEAEPVSINSYVATLKAGGQDSNHVEIADRLVELRRQMRIAKQWKLADTIRSGLAEVGISLEDTPQGTVWKYVKPG